MHRDISKYNYFMPETRDMIFRNFKMHFEVEESIETMKKRMSRRPNFNVNNLFIHIDYQEEHMLSRDCFKKILMDNKHYPTDSEIGWLFDRFDRNRNGMINFQEFTEEIMPKNSFH